MSMKKIAAISLVGSRSSQRYFRWLSFSRQLNTGFPLCRRSHQKILQDRNLSIMESEGMTIEDLNEIANPDVDTFMQQTKNVERDANRFRHFIQQKTIEQKYFKQYEDTEENLLTWDMKQQLKYLHATDPDEWSPEALVAAFPISVAGVKKLLKSRWVPDDDASIERHDRAVLYRWRKYTNGRLGSVKLLEETLRKRLGRSNENVPIPVMDPEKIMTTLDNLRFEHDEKPATTGEKVKPIGKKHNLRSGSFTSIIEDYEEQISRNKHQDAQSARETQEKQKSSKHIDLGLVLSGPPEYEGSYSRISADHSGGRGNRATPHRRKRGNKELMTFDKFMKSKAEV